MLAGCSYDDPGGDGGGSGSGSSGSVDGGLDSSGSGGDSRIEAADDYYGRGHNIDGRPSLRPPMQEQSKQQPRQQPRQQSKQQPKQQSKQPRQQQQLQQQQLQQHQPLKQQQQEQHLDDFPDFPQDDFQSLPDLPDLPITTNTSSTSTTPGLQPQDLEELESLQRLQNLQHFQHQHAQQQSLQQHLQQGLQQGLQGLPQHPQQHPDVRFQHLLQQQQHLQHLQHLQKQHLQKQHQQHPNQHPKQHPSQRLQPPQDTLSGLLLLPGSPQSPVLAGTGTASGAGARPRSSSAPPERVIGMPFTAAASQGFGMSPPNNHQQSPMLRNQGSPVNNQPSSGNNQNSSPTSTPTPSQHTSSQTPTPTDLYPQSPTLTHSQTPVLAATKTTAPSGAVHDRAGLVFMHPGNDPATPFVAAHHSAPASASAAFVMPATTSSKPSGTNGSLGNVETTTTTTTPTGTTTATTATTSLAALQHQVEPIPGALILPASPPRGSSTSPRASPRNSPRGRGGANNSRKHHHHHKDNSHSKQSHNHHHHHNRHGYSHSRSSSSQTPDSLELGVVGADGILEEHSDHGGVVALSLAAPEPHPALRPPKPQILSILLETRLCSSGDRNSNSSNHSHKHRNSSSRNSNSRQNNNHRSRRTVAAAIGGGSGGSDQDLEHNGFGGDKDDPRVYEGEDGDGGEDEAEELPMIRRLFPWCRLWSFITLISVVQLILFAITLIVAQHKFDGAFVAANPMGGPSARALRYMGGIYEPSLRQGSLHLLLTPLLLHAGVVHLVFNLYFQTRLGYGLERRFGTRNLVVVYLFTGLCAVLLSAIEKDSYICVGSSGALFGLMGADLVFVLYNRSQVMFWQLECVAIVAIVLINFLLGLFPGIDNFAHLGGLIAGLPMGIAVAPQVEPRAKAVLWRALAGLAALGWLLALVFTFVFADLRD